MQTFGAPPPSKQIISLGRIITKKRGGEGYRVEAEGQKWLLKRSMPFKHLMADMYTYTNISYPKDLSCEINSLLYWFAQYTPKIGQPKLKTLTAIKQHLAISRGWPLKRVFNSCVVHNEPNSVASLSPMVKTTQASNFQTQALMTTTLYFKIKAILFAHKLTFTGSPSLHF